MFAPVTTTVSGNTLHSTADMNVLIMAVTAGYQATIRGNTIFHQGLVNSVVEAYLTIGSHTNITQAVVVSDNNVICYTNDNHCYAFLIVTGTYGAVERMGNLTVTGNNVMSKPDDIPDVTDGEYRAAAIMIDSWSQATVTGNNLMHAFRSIADLSDIFYCEITVSNTSQCNVSGNTMQSLRAASGAASSVTRIAVTDAAYVTVNGNVLSHVGHTGVSDSAVLTVPDTATLHVVMNNNDLHSAASVLNIGAVDAGIQTGNVAEDRGGGTPTYTNNAGASTTEYNVSL
jgi:hypothetical protein